MRDSASATELWVPWIWRISVMNWEIRSKWRIWRSECRSEREESKCKGRVVHPDVKLASLQKIAKMLYSKIDGKQPSFKCAIPSLSILRLREECDWTQLPLTYCWRTVPTAMSDASVIRHRGIWSWVNQECGVSKSLFDVVEGSSGWVRPGERIWRATSNFQEVGNGLEGSSTMRNKPSIKIDKS